MTTVTDSSTAIHSGIGGKIARYSWHWQGKQYQVVHETIGEGNSILLLPAFSKVSSRSEMKGIAQILANQYQVTVLDWLGFGESECPPVDYNCVLFKQLLPDECESGF